jgi:competence protein ComEC
MASSRKQASWSVLLIIILAAAFTYFRNPVQKTSGPLPEPRHELTVTFIDVGQADSILIRSASGRTMLIDAGNREDADLVQSQVEQTASRSASGEPVLDVVIGTHPHEDHIGGLAALIRSSAVGRIIMPRAETNTATFEDTLSAIKERGLKITPARAGLKLDLDSETKVEFLAPNGDSYDDLNNYSAVVKLTYQQVTLLFTGDAERLSEGEMLDRGYDLRADVLKVGHHGSRSSTGAAFLKAVGPRYAVISVGAGNSYGHPSQAVLKRLAKSGVNVFRTDRDGTVTLRSDGEQITWETSKGAFSE